MAAKKAIRLPIAIAAALVVVAGLLFLGANLLIPLAARKHIVSDLSQAPEAQCAIVLGAKVYPDGTPAPMLADRLETGIKLYEIGKVKKLLLSGDHGQATYDEVNVMLEYVLARGVPSEDVFTDHAGFDTYDTMYRARDVFQVRTALVVTQAFHLPRAVYTARTLGLEATGVAADIQPYTDELQNRAREWLARVKAALELHITHPKPKYLGSPIPIEGDGRSTRR
ncbi:MAG: YdcF family protein [Thermoleophilia bacterium]|nr:YdcF family protein [Thermoleophilia bacterium]